MNKKILIVDDDNLILELYSEFLSQHGYEVYSADKVDEAIEIFRKYDPDVVISDVIMHENTGFDLYYRLKMINKTLNFIFMTGYEYDRKIIEKIESLGCKWIAKPIKFEDLLNLIESF